MTICIGAINSNSRAVVIATDSMLTNARLSIEFEHPTNKITFLSDSCVALTAGDALAHTELFNSVQNKINNLKSPSVSDIVEVLKESYQIIRQREIKERILQPKGFSNIKEFHETQRMLIPEIAMTIQNEIDRYDFGLEILVAGITYDGAHLYGIADPGTSFCYDSLGFNAIGSGLPHAINNLIVRNCFQGNSLSESLLIVYESKKMAEKAPGVGKNITNICIITQNSIIQLSNDKISTLDRIY